MKPTLPYATTIIRYDETYDHPFPIRIEITTLANPAPKALAMKTTELYHPIILAV
jgi:hypothetical protein